MLYRWLVAGAGPVIGGRRCGCSVGLNGVVEDVYWPRHTLTHSPSPPPAILHTGKVNKYATLPSHPVKHHFYIENVQTGSLVAGGCCIWLMHSILNPGYCIQSRQKTLIILKLLHIAQQTGSLVAAIAAVVVAVSRLMHLITARDANDVEPVAHSATNRVAGGCYRSCCGGGVQVNAFNHGQRR